MPKKILIVEDDKHIQISLKDVLDSDGYEVRIADNGKDALEKLEKGPLPDLIILDIMMPIKDGITFRKEQMENERIKEIPVIFLTANNSLIDEAVKLKPYEFLNKPLDLKDLTYVLDSFFYERSVR